MVAVSDLAVSYGLGSELLLSAVSARMASAGGRDLVRGRLEGGLLYTPAYLRNVKAGPRPGNGAAAGATRPFLTNAEQGGRMEQAQGVGAVEPDGGRWKRWSPRQPGGLGPSLCPAATAESRWQGQGFEGQGSEPDLEPNLGPWALDPGPWALGPELAPRGPS